MIKKALLIVLALSVSVLLSGKVFADESAIFNTPVAPNVLFILDISNSMDEDFYGSAVGSYSTSSKSVVGRNALTSIINTYAGQMNMGLMTFKLPSAPSVNYLYNSAYFVSYDPRSYCPSFTSLPQATQTACINYCIKGDADSADMNLCQSGCRAGTSSAPGNAQFTANYQVDGLIDIGTSPVNSTLRQAYCPLVYPKTTAIQNPTTGQSANNIYYSQALPEYTNSNPGSNPAPQFYVSTSYSLNAEAPGPMDPSSCTSATCNKYNIYTSKTGTSDGTNSSAGYSGGPSGPYWVSPSESDPTYGYFDFGQNMFSYYVGQAWFLNSSPGNGFLNLPVAPVTGTQQTNFQALLGSVDTSAHYMSGTFSSANNANCTSSSNLSTCHLVNAGCTPTAGTFESAYDYFAGLSDYQTSSVKYTSPIQYQCQQNFIVFVTDGLPSADESGVSTKTSSQLIDGVVSRITKLRKSGGFTYALSGTTYPFDIQTYVLGEGLASGDKLLVDKMAVAGGTDVGTHAYYADNPTQLVTSLGSALSDIVAKTYSFTTTSVSSSRISDENYLYEASFQPTNSDPFWQGDIVKYSINADGSVGSALWHAGTQLQSMTSSSRNIYTYKGGALVAFNTSNILPADLGVSTAAQQAQIVGYIRGDSSYNPETLPGQTNTWKLGDIFHSNIITIGTPSLYYNDTRDANGAFASFRAAHVRSSAAGGNRVLIGGANDGQFHVFLASNGMEQWSFVPPNLLPKLQYLAHTSNPSTLPHQYFADGPVVVADAWLGSVNDTAKSVSDWHTMTVLSVGKSDPSYTKYYWSSSSSCDSNFNATYSATYHYYCGYYAFDFTNTLSPSYMWKLNPTSTDAPYLGEPWGKMAVGKVLINGVEKWVGFTGDGYASANCTGTGTCDTRGKGFSVIDLSNGNILWSRTRATSSTMNYSFAGSPAIIDTDSDGFIDTVYIGDMGNNMWRFKLCTAAMGNTCNTNNWTGSAFYTAASTEISPVYTTPTVARSAGGNIWVYWGTGDRVNPTVASTQDHLYAVKDDLVHGVTKGSLTDISNVSTKYTDSPSLKGWYMNLAQGEKMLSDPVVFGGVLYYSTYTPSTSGNPCTSSGTGTVYGVNYISGAAVAGLDTAGRVIATGSGLATAPTISLGPPQSSNNTGNGNGTGNSNGTSDLYINFSGGPGSNSQLVHEGNIPDTATRNRILYWRDHRVK